MVEAFDLTENIAEITEENLEDRLGEALAFTLSYLYDVSQGENFNVLEIAPAGQHTVGIAQSPLKGIMSRASISEKLRQTKVQISGAGDIVLDGESLEFTLGENAKYASVILRKDDAELAWLDDVFEANEGRPNIVFGRNIFDHSISNVMGQLDQEEEITPAVINALPERGFVVVFNDSGLEPSLLNQDPRMKHINTFTFEVPAEESEAKAILIFQKKEDS